MKPNSAGPKHPMKDYLECATLDSTLKREYEAAGYSRGQELTRDQALEILNSMYLGHPEMRNLYDLPSAMLDNASEEGRSNWFNASREWIYGQPAR